MTGYQIPRNSLAWLLAAQVAVIAPHVGRLPIWVTLVALACIGWRVMVYQGRWNYPGRWTKVLFVLVSVACIPLGYHRILGVEPWVAIMVLAYVLKLLEMHHQRDAYIVVLLGYFVAMTEFLFDQSIGWTLYVFGSVAMITAGLVGLNQTRTHLKPVLTLRTAFVLLGQSLPLMVVLFLLFPRLPPLWTVPMPADVARTGVTDRMSPGDVSRLSRSAALAFKVTFDGPAPPRDQLYWRGLVLTRFDGTTWAQEPGFQSYPWFSGKPAPDWAKDTKRLGDRVSYTVILEPTQQHWLFSLTAPEVPRQQDVVMLRDYRLASTERIENKLRYHVTSDLDYRIGSDSSAFWRYRAKVLPRDIDPRARALATKLRASSTDTRDYIRRVMDMYRTGGFAYTLDPPKLSGANTVDEFLFSSKRGFCEHFAGSFVFLMRAANIPARVVIGYQGGEFNQFGNYYAVYQYDAHAWAEVWLPGEGWVREDPTAVVSPARIEEGLAAAAGGDAAFLSDSPLSLWSRQTLWLADLRLQLSAIAYYWDSWVVGYTPETQADLLTRLFGHISRARIGVVMLVAFFGILALVGFFILLKRPHEKHTPLDREYLRFCRALERQGLARRRGEGPLDYSRRISASRPDLATLADEVTQTYVELNYGGNRTGDHTRLKRAVRRFRIKALA